MTRGRKKQIAIEISDDLGIPVTKVEEMIDSFLREVKREVIESGRLELRGFGTFEIRELKSRKRHNPQDMSEVASPAMQVVRFSAGDRFKADANCASF